MLWGVSLRRLVQVHFLHVILVKRLLDALAFLVTPVLGPALLLILLKDTVELLGPEKGVLYPCLLLLLVPDLIVLSEVVIDAHISPEVNGGQLRLNIYSLGESIEVVGALFGVKERVVSAEGLLTVEVSE